MRLLMSAVSAQRAADESAFAAAAHEARKRAWEAAERQVRSELLSRRDTFFMRDAEVSRDRAMELNEEAALFDRAAAALGREIVAGWVAPLEVAVGGTDRSTWVSVEVEGHEHFIASGPTRAQVIAVAAARLRAAAQRLEESL